jgi:hypothetical protein
MMKKLLMILINFIKSIIRVVLYLVLSPIWIFPVIYNIAIDIELKQLDLANKVRRIVK